MTAVVAQHESFLLADPKLTSLVQAWSRPGRLALFAEEVLPLALPDATVASTAIEDMTYSPRRECVILYSLAFEGDVAPRYAVATVSKDDRLNGVFARSYAGGRNGRAVLLSERRCLVELFPADWKLPSLLEAVDADLAARLLGVGVNATDVTVLRYRPHQRCVLRYGHPGGARSVVKVFRHPDKAAITWNVLQSLHATPALGVAVPRPVGFARRRNSLVMEHVDGVSLKDELRGARDERQASAAAELAAAVLVRLHQVRLDGGPERRFAEELAQLRRRVVHFREVAPTLGVEVDATLERLEAMAPVVSWRGRSFVHGDYKPSQLLLADGQLALTDFDRAARGDPALDVGNFMAQFRKEALNGGAGHVRRASASFLAAYEALSPRRPVAERALVYEALALTRMAVRSFRRSPHVYAKLGPASAPHKLIDEARRCLDAL